MILVIGRTGQLATEFLQKVRGKQLFAFADREQFDLTWDKERMVEKLKTYGARMIINCAAYTNTNVPLDFYSNVYDCMKTSMGLVTLGEACKWFDMPLITFSSNYVFPTQSNPINFGESAVEKIDPMNAYSYGKLMSEKNLLKVHPRTTIIRLSNLMSSHHSNILTKAIGALFGGVTPTCGVVEDTIKLTPVSSVVDFVLSNLLKFTFDKEIIHLDICKECTVRELFEFIKGYVGHKLSLRGKDIISSEHDCITPRNVLLATVKDYDCNNLNSGWKLEVTKLLDEMMKNSNNDLL